MGAMRRKPHWYLGSWTDRLLLVLAIAGIAYTWHIALAMAGHGRAMVEIYRDHVLLAKYPLHGNYETPLHIHAKGTLGTSEIVLDNRGVYFESSPCPNHQCVLAGHKHRRGDMIVCVPNHILVTIRGDANALDAVAE